MRINTLAVICLMGSGSTAAAFTTKPFINKGTSSAYVSIQQKHQRPSSLPPLYMSAPPYFANDVSSEDIDRKLSQDIAAEISSGKILSVHSQTTTSPSSDNDSVVFDFASVQNHASRSETALREAKAEYLRASPAPSSTNKRLMGINDDVVREVGREIGDFATSDETIQRCASYLRSLAPAGLFSSSNVSFDAAEINEYRTLLDQSYEESGAITSAFAKTFYLGTSLLPPTAARSIWAIYVWCRRTDEIVDAPRSDDDNDMLSDLSAWEVRLERLFAEGEVVDVLDLALLDVRRRYPKLSIQPFLDMIRGMLMDIPELGVERYGTFEELHLYCYRVAGTVGLMSMPIFGCAQGFTEETAKEPALSLGVAFQITNILRDVGEDATTRNRIYLPLSSLAEHNVTEEQIYAQRIDDNYRNLMKSEIRRARSYYRKARTGVPMLSPSSRLPVQVSLDCYEKILDKIEENGYDSLNQRAYVSKWEKLATVPFSWYKTLEISKVLPLPGDVTI